MAVIGQLHAAVDLFPEKILLVFIGRKRRVDLKKKFVVSFETEKSLLVLEAEPWFSSKPFH